MVNGNDVVPTVPLPFSVKPFPAYQHTGEMHRLLPDGGMEILPFGADVPGDLPKEKGVGDFLRSTTEFLKGTLQARGRISQSFLDHAPVNYIARLERLRTTI
jgi:hypothetical protein